MREIDCLGEMCPIPVIKITQALEIMVKGETIKVITDHSCVVQSISDHFSRKCTSVRCDEVMNGIWEVHVTKI
ncbi:MAG: response regulator SirA [Clostridiales bacterium GWC2_40_7]|nr:MAG: response regulator SirA [Clostridiales bacterium GWC2_40_7]